MGIVSSANIENVGFNVSSEFKKIDDAVGYQLKDNANDIRIRIMDDESRSDGISNMNEGYEKISDTIYMFNESLEVGNYPYSKTTHSFSYGEFIKVDGKRYWVEVSSDDIENPNYDKCWEYLEYFNEHNTFEPIKA